MGQSNVPLIKHVLQSVPFLNKKLNHELLGILPILHKDSV